MSMDETDVLLVTLLQADGRASVTELAEKLSLSRAAVGERMRRLEREGVIQGYAAIVDPRLANPGVTAFVYLRVSGVPAEEDAMLRRLSEWPEIVELHNVAGEDCYLAKVRARDMSALSRVVEALRVPPFRMSTRTTIVLETRFERVGGVMAIPPHDVHDDPEIARRVGWLAGDEPQQES